jgi:hypothetical protein
MVLEPSREYGRARRRLHVPFLLIANSAARILLADTVVHARVGFGDGRRPRLATPSVNAA